MFKDNLQTGRGKFQRFPSARRVESLDGLQKFPSFRETLNIIFIRPALAGHGGIHARQDIKREKGTFTCTGGEENGGRK